MGEAESLRQELTKLYVPKKPMTLKLTTQTPNAVKVGDKLKIEFGSLDSYLQDAETGRVPYSCQWALTFHNESGQTIGILKHDKSTIQNLFDVEVVETFFHMDYAEEKERSNWEGYPFRLVLTPYKSNKPTPP
jgi:hypothetical protein